MSNRIRRTIPSPSEVAALLSYDPQTGSLRADTGKWHARITIKGKVVLLGNFSDIDDAIAARAAAEPKYHAEFARSE